MWEGSDAMRVLKRTLKRNLKRIDASLEANRACYTHTYIHTYIHTYTYINKYIINPRPVVGSDRLGRPSEKGAHTLTPPAPRSIMNTNIKKKKIIIIIFFLLFFYVFFFAIAYMFMCIYIKITMVIWTTYRFTAG